MIEIPKQLEENQRLKWNAWKEQEVTKDFFQMLENRLGSTFNEWAAERFNGNDLHSFVAQNAKAQGGTQVIQEMLNLDFTDIYLVRSAENEQERDTPNRGPGPYRPRGD